MSAKIVERIEKDLGTPRLAEALADRLSGSDLYSLMLAVLKRKVHKIEAAQISNSSPLTKSCGLDARLINKLEGIAYDVASNYEAIELSPLCSLGSVARLSALEQSNVLSTIKSFECASDPTIGMAIECASRRKNLDARKATTRLCTNQRVIRLPLPANPAFTAHFKLFALVNAGRDTGSFNFESAALKEHLEFYLNFLTALKDSGHFDFSKIEVEISHTFVVSHLCSRLQIDKDEIRTTVRARDASTTQSVLSNHSVNWPKTINSPATELLEFALPAYLLKQLEIINDGVIAPLQKEHPQVEFGFNLHRLTGLSYYKGPCFHIKLKNALGETFNLADGGLVDWTQTLLTDSKERLMTSAIGTELLCRIFKP